MIHLLLEKLKRRVGNRWFTLDSLPDRVNATRTNRILNSRAARKRFPIRGLRYWWIRCALLEEIERREGEVVIADIGCSRGHGKLFVGDLPKTRWVGLDLNMDRGVLRECGYSELHQCDFDKPLPLAENSVDIVVFSHVIEHLLRPELTVGELSRILRPGGVLIAGSPVAPSLIAKAHEWHLQKAVESRTHQARRSHQFHVPKAMETAPKCAGHECGNDDRDISCQVVRQSTGKPRMVGSAQPVVGRIISRVGRRNLSNRTQAALSANTTGDFYPILKRRTTALPKMGLGCRDIPFLFRHIGGSLVVDSAIVPHSRHGRGASRRQ